MFHAVFCIFFVCCVIVFEIFLLYFVPVFFKLKQFCTPFGSKYPCGTKKTHSRRSALFLLLCSNLQRMSMKICHHNSILSLINSLILSLFTFPIQSPALAPLAPYLRHLRHLSVLLPAVFRRFLPFFPFIPVLSPPR